MTLNQSSSELFTPDFKATSYWWDGAPLSTDRVEAFPTSADVVVVGSGYTGLHAALQTARAGMHTVVLDAESIGFGCSTRNGGQISTSIKYDYQALCKRHGEALARDILAMGQASLDFIGDFVEREGIDCSFNVAGRFHGAHSEGAFREFGRTLKAHNPVFDDGAYLVSRSEQHSELGTDVYCGGMVYPHYAGIDPGRYHAGCLQRTQAAGATLIGHSAVSGIDRQGEKFLVRSARGDVLANEVIIATNGYTGNSTPWQQRRLIPIGSYIIATEPLDPAMMDVLFPTNRMLTDSRKLVYYYRPSPDRRRVLFGGRVSLSETDPYKSAVKLRAELVRLFPALRDVKISHSWAGTVAYTFDSMMHSGVHDGMHYAMGYCGSGVGMASYLGYCVGGRVAGTMTEDVPVASIDFPTRPLYSGNPWFLAPTIGWYRLRDRIT